MRSIILNLLCFLMTSAYAAPGDILFVTQPPWPPDFATINSTFGNHLAAMDAAPRGGDLMIRYADGTLKNLTQSAGYGVTGMQGASAIAVRDPHVHWDGEKALFSMVIGAPTRQYEVKSYRWQLYEIRGLARDQTPIISKVINQPTEYNNVMGVYATDDSIIFASDRPRNGEAHLYPQRDEYESTATNSGLWRLNPVTGDLFLIDHSPSGDFHPLIDSFGRVIFTRWDHLQRDQQRDAGGYGTFDYSSESKDSKPLSQEVEIFPEARSDNNADKKSYEELHKFNQFFPWMVNQDGTDLETLNHIGRHELSGYLSNSRNDDPNIVYTGSGGERPESEAFLQISEDPQKPGSYIAINAPEFNTHASGQIIRIVAPPSKNPDSIGVEYLTHPDTASASNSPRASHSGLYRDPKFLTDGSLVASHTSNTREDLNEGTGAAPKSRFSFRLMKLTQNGSYWRANTPLTPGIKKSISYWSPDYLISFGADLWELQPVEVVARIRAQQKRAELPDIERGVFEASGVSLRSFEQFLADRDLALIIGRNMTSRDAADRQQPFNLQVPGTGLKTVGAAGRVYDISFLQIFQGDLLRGYGGADSPEAGRRVLARHMQGLPVGNLPSGSSFPASVSLAKDGSFAAFVPARRALTWQLLDPNGDAVVRERYWLTFQPGEIRVCGSCHGVNSFDQAGGPAPLNRPEALKMLLASYNDLPPVVNSPAPQPPPSKPSFKIALQKGRRTVKQLLAKDRFEVVVHGESSSAQNLSLKILLEVGSCSQTLLITTDQTGRGTLFGRVPSDVARGELKVTLMSGADTLATASVNLKRGAGKRAGAKRCAKWLLNSTF